MRSSRVWLSIAALLSGITGIWAAVSLDLLSPIRFGTLSQLELLACGIGFLIPLCFWGLIFFRQRGRLVLIGSRFPLSLSGFICGAWIVMVLLHLRVILPLSVSNVPTLDFVLFVVGTALPVVIWFSIFFVKRTHEEDARSQEL